MQQFKENTLIAGLLVVFAIATRLLFNTLHIYNFNGVMAAGLFGGAFLTKSKFGVLIPIAAMLVTDVVIGFYDWHLMAIVYAAFAITFLYGRLLSRNTNVTRWLIATIGGSLTFFVLTNAAVWLFGDGTFYPHTLAGLVDSFAMGLPFYKNTLIGDLVFSTALFGGFYAIARGRLRTSRVSA